MSSGVIYAGSGRALFRSSDAGRTWTALSIRASGAEQPELSGVLATALVPNVVHAMGRARDGGVWRSTDSGNTWRPANFGLPNSAEFVQDAAMDAFDPNLIYIRIGAEVYKTSNAGANWARISTLNPAGSYLALLVSPANRRTIYHATSGAVFRSTDEGATWTPYYSAPGSRPILAAAVDRLNSDYVLAHYSGGLPESGGETVSEIVRSTDAGIHWDPVAPAGALQRLVVASGNVFYGITTAGAVARTANAANSWSFSAPGVAVALAVDPLDPAVVYIGRNGVSRSIDAGASFTPLNGAVRPNFTRPAPIAFRVRAGESASIQVPVRAHENPEWAIPFETSTSEAWLRWSAAGGTTPSTLALSADTANLAPGTFTAQARLQSSQAAAPLIFSVTVLVDPLGASGPQFMLSGFGETIDVPSAVSVDPAGNAFVSNTAGVFRTPSAGAPARLAAFAGTAGLLAAADGSIYVAATTPPALMRIAGGAVNTLFTASDAGAAGAPSFLPRRVRFDNQGNLLIAATGSILRFSPLLNPPIAVLATAPAGASFDDVAADQSGNLFIADATRNAVLHWDAASRQLATVAGRPGAAGLAGDSGPALDSLLNSPRGLQRAADGTLYIADTGNSRIRAITPDGRIFSLPPYSGLRAPADLALRSGGSLLVADSGNNRLAMLAPLRNLPEITRGGFVNAAGNRPFLSPGSLFTLYGSNLSLNLDTASDAPWPAILGGTSVSINGRAAPLFYVSGNQINGQVPFEVQPGATAVVVSSASLTSSPVIAPLLTAAPGILIYGEDRAVAVNPSGAVNGPGSPVEAGSVITVYLTGIGPLDTAVATGAAAPSQSLVRATSARRATIGERDCEVQFLGLAPGFVGLAQANIRVPAGLEAGDNTLVITVNGVESNPARVAVF